MKKATQKEIKESLHRLTKLANNCKQIGEDWKNGKATWAQWEQAYAAWEQENAHLDALFESRVR